MSTVLTADDVGHLRTGAHFLACAIDPTAIHVYAGMIQEAMQDRSVELITVDELAPDDLVVAVGMVTQGLFIADMPPVGDEFTGCIEAIETRLGRKVRAIYSLAAANINGIIPLMVGLQSSLPVIDSDPMGRVFPLISQTTLNIGGVAIGPIALMGVTGERAVVEAGDPQRAETLVRALVTELGGWAATVMYPCPARQLAEHGVHGSISRMIRIGQILDADTSAESKFLSLSDLLGVTRIARARVSHIEGLSRPTDLGLPAQPSSVTLEDETTGQIIRLEIQNEILLVLVDGAVAAAVPDMVTLLNSEHGSVASLDDLRVGNVVDVLKLNAAPQWYSEAGLDLAEPAAFGIPSSIQGGAVARSVKDTRLDVAGLLAHGSLRGTAPLYLTPTSALIESVVLVSQLEAIQGVRPNTVVVLSAEMGSGGWLVSAALRHAWERRASAVVVAGSTYSSAVTGLAERLGITLLASEGNPAGVALSLAAEIGAALSVVDAELARFARAVARDSTLADVLKTISGELDGVGVSLEYDGVVLASAGTAPRDPAEVITVDVGVANAAVPSALTARVPASGVLNLRLVRSILEVAAPSVKAAWLMGNSRDAARAVPTAALAGLNQGRGSSGATFEEDHWHLLSQLGWRRHERYAAVWICRSGLHVPGNDLTAVLRLLWRKVAARSPLAEVDGGWLALVPAAHEAVVAQLELRLKARLQPALAELGLVAGLSRWAEEATPLPSIIQEARLAAVSAQSAGQGTVLGFAGLGVAAATTFVDKDAVALVAELTLPRLMASGDRDAIVAAVAAFLDHRGSVSLAAAALDVHRNTLQARLGRARELGVPLDNPSELLSVHLILDVLRAAREKPTPKDPHKDPHETRKDSHEFPV